MAKKHGVVTTYRPPSLSIGGSRGEWRRRNNAGKKAVYQNKHRRRPRGVEARRNKQAYQSRASAAHARVAVKHVISISNAGNITKAPLRAC